MSDQTLQTWIMTATAGLPPSAVEKFSTEISDHFAEARRRHLAEGMPPDEADRAALAGLGDAEQVARVFRDAHFSRAEYTRGAAAALATLILFVLTYVLPRLRMPWVSASQTTYELFSRGIEIAGDLAAVLGFVLVVHAALTLLAEQYDIRLPRRHRRAAITLGLLTFAPQRLMVLVGTTFERTPESVLSPLYLYVFDPLSDAASYLCYAALVAGGALTAVYCARYLAQGWGERRPLRQLLLILAGSGGAMVAVSMSIWTIAFQILRVSPETMLANPAGALLAYSLGPLIDLPMLCIVVLLAALAILFFRLQRPGAVILR